MTALDETREVSLEALSGSTVMVNGEAISVGKFSINQWLALGKLATSAMDTLTARDAQKLQAAQNGEASAAALSTMAQWIMATFEPEVVGKAFELITGKPGAWCLDNFDIDTLTELVTAVKAHNNPARLIALFRPARPTLAGTDPAADPATPPPPLPMTANGQHAN